MLESPYKEHYLLSLTMEEVGAIRTLMSDKVANIKTKLKKLKKLLHIHFYTLRKTAKVKAVFQCLEHFYQIEIKMKVDYSPEEKLAEIEKVPHDDNAIAISLARMFSKDPEEILRWQYIKVLGVLNQLNEESLYQKRLQKVYESKQKVNKPNIK